MRHLLELDGDLRSTFRKAFARSQVEGHVRPAPVVDLEARRDEGLGLRVRVDVGLLAIARHFLGRDPAPPVLAADDVAHDLRLGGWRDGPDDLDLLVPQRVRVERGGRLHRHE